MRGGRPVGPAVAVAAAPASAGGVAKPEGPVEKAVEAAESEGIVLLLAAAVAVPVGIGIALLIPAIAAAVTGRGTAALAHFHHLFIGSLYLFELFLCGRVVRMKIRVVALALLAIGFFNVVVAGGGGYAENLIRVHQEPAFPFAFC